MATSEEPQATRDWYTRALIRVKETTTKRSVDPYREYTFHIGEELEMVQWGRAGRPVKRDHWWTSFDIDGALIIEASKVEIVKVLDEKLPDEEELQEPPEMYLCQYCGQHHPIQAKEFYCPLDPNRLK